MADNDADVISVESDDETDTVYNSESLLKGFYRAFVKDGVKKSFSSKKYQLFMQDINSKPQCPERDQIIATAKEGHYATVIMFAKARLYEDLTKAGYDDLAKKCYNMAYDF